MDELNKTDESIEELVDENEELGFTDKIVSVLTEPGELFSSLAKLPVKTMDWLIPILTVIVFAIAMQFVISTNPEIKSNMIETQLEQMEKGLQEAVDKGQMTQAQADEQIERTAEFMENSGSGMLIFGSISIVIMIFLFFFIISGVFLLLAKFGLGGSGDYKASMLAYGMPQYIMVLQVILMIISAVVFGKVFRDTSLGSYMGMEKTGILGWLMYKLDPMLIWFYAVVGIAYAKMFKSDNTPKYIIAIFAMWLGFTLLFHFLAEAVPFLKQFGM